MLCNLIKKVRGFTLVELVMVIVIIGMLAAIVLPNFTSQRGQAAIATTKANLESLRTAIALYYANEGTYAALDADPLGDLHDGGATGGRIYINDIPPETISTTPSQVVVTAISGVGGWFWDTTSHRIAPNNPNTLSVDENGQAYNTY